MNELYGGRPRPPVGGEVYWLRSVPVARGRAGREGHVWPWNPTSPRRRAFHSTVLSLPSSLSSSPHVSLFTVYPAPLRVPLLPSRYRLSASLHLSSRSPPPIPFTRGVFELAFFDSLLLFENSVVSASRRLVAHATFNPGRNCNRKKIHAKIVKIYKISFPRIHVLIIRDAPNCYALLNGFYLADAVIKARFFSLSKTFNATDINQESEMRASLRLEHTRHVGSARATRNVISH